MGTPNFSDRVFRDNLRRERQSRQLSLAHLATLLQAKGLRIYTTTIAKLESGERAAKLDEVVALADVFNLSIDALVGRSGRRSRSGDKSLPLHALAERTASTAVAVDALEAGVREHLAELEAFTLRRDEAAAATECERAAQALAEAATASRQATAKLQRVQQRMQREFLTDDSHNDDEGTEE